jgi:hypothetical protein
MKTTLFALFALFHYLYTIQKQIASKYYIFVVDLLNIPEKETAL